MAIMKIANRMQGFKSSVGFELLKIGQKLQAQGEDVISLSIGLMELNTFEPLRNAAKQALDDGHTKYTPSEGTQSLRIKLAQQATKQFSIPFDASEVFVGSGCKSLLFVVFQCLCNPGDEVILPTPYWMSYPPTIQLSGAKIRYVNTKAQNNFKITAQELEASITDKSKIFLLNSPNNPTGAIYSEQELKDLGSVLEANPGITLLCDSIYDLMSYSYKIAPHILTSCPQLKNQVLAMNGASKSYLMTGWRLGWLFGPKKIIKTFSAFQSQSIGCPNSIVQKAFEQAGSLCDADIQTMVKNLKSLRDILVGSLSKIPHLKLFPADGAFYLWIDVQAYYGKSYQNTKITSSKDIMELLLTHYKVLCICGEEFGREGYLRLSYVVNEARIKKACSRLQDFFSKLQ